MILTEKLKRAQIYDAHTHATRKVDVVPVMSNHVVPRHWHHHIQLQDDVQLSCE